MDATNHVTPAISPATEADFNWARLSTTSVSVWQTCFTFMARLWITSLKAEGFQTARAAQSAVEGAIKAMSTNSRSTGRDCWAEINGLHEKFYELETAIKAAIERRAVIFSSDLREGVKEWRLLWQSMPVESQYVLVFFNPLRKGMTVDWCVDADQSPPALQTNLHLRIPQLAREWVQADKSDNSKIEPLFNVERAVCAKLGLDLTHIQTKGMIGVSNAKKTLQNHQRKLEKEAKEEAKKAGFVPFGEE